MVLMSLASSPSLVHSLYASVTLMTFPVLFLPLVFVLPVRLLGALRTGL